jgi:hypothetical protein
MLSDHPTALTVRTTNTTCLIAPSTMNAIQFYRASTAISVALTALHYEHAIIGGAACALLGSDRTSYDIDVVVNLGTADARDVKRAIAVHDTSFEIRSNGMYFCDYPIELLPTSAFTWPVPLTQGSQTLGNVIHILSPLALIVSKAKRAATLSTSTRPKSILKCASDSSDIEYLSTLVKDVDVVRILGLYPTDRVDQLVGNLKVLSERSMLIEGLCGRIERLWGEREIEGGDSDA